LFALSSKFPEVTHNDVTIVGGGLAGCEAAWQLAQRGVGVRLYEMRPGQRTPAHQSDRLAELVCSNSLRAADRQNAVGLLKEEMRVLDSLILRAADRHAIPGGGALVVDREGFSLEITRAISSHPRIQIARKEIDGLDGILGASQSPVLIATGPLTSPALAEEIARRTGADSLYFYDSIAPIVEAGSIDPAVVFRASRYDKGEAAYLNCPMTREEYEGFIDALLAAEKAELAEFDRPLFFEACLPVEVMAERGRHTLAFGPMKPVGLIDPRTGRRPFAVVQLRQDDLHASLYNMVGFQTRMKYPEQTRVFRMIPGLENARFARLGSMHRNTFLNAPRLLDDQLCLKVDPRLHFAGQMIGVEGYVESAAMGLYAGLVLSQKIVGEKTRPPDPTTALGALIRHLTQASPRDFQPMNVNFGLFVLPPGLKRKDRREALADAALHLIREFKTQFRLLAAGEESEDVAPVRSIG
jgi:methylenetetrahydrofolate--tRNA-(uracil-5-)-methyltransferase